LVIVQKLTNENQSGRIQRRDRFRPSEKRKCLRTVIGLLLMATLGGAGCTDNNANSNEETIVVGASLPFTGKEAALGRNIEQAILLALEDVNAAGGIDGIPLSILSRDSNSGSDRGLNDLLDILYNQKVKYLIGPDENDLATEIVSDVKKSDVLNILPGIAAPSIARSSLKGAWLKLAPSPFDTGCALAGRATDDGAKSANALASQEDYNSSLRTNFVSQFAAFGGEAKSSVSIKSGQNSYQTALKRLNALDADRTLLVAYPGTASTIVTEWAVTGNQTKWYLSPLLRTEAFLLNIPSGSLDGEFGLSPSISLASECGDLGKDHHGVVDCERGNSEKFFRHFADRWDGAEPFTASLFYYDAVVLLAMGMLYGHSELATLPGTKALQKIIRNLNDTKNDPGYWNKLPEVFRELKSGKQLRYVGVAAEYVFDEYGAAQHRVFDSWTIRNAQFVGTGSYYANCTPYD
jgi:neutral amino acid transport system substrate-binding protein